MNTNMEIKPKTLEIDQHDEETNVGLALSIVSEGMQLEDVARMMKVDKNARAMIEVTGASRQLLTMTAIENCLKHGYCETPSVLLALRLTCRTARD